MTVESDDLADLRDAFIVVEAVTEDLNVKSEVFLRLWDKFRAHGIEIPFPQLDLHLKTPSVLSLAMPDVASASPAAGPRLAPATP